MRTNGTKPVYPIGHNIQLEGLTKREYFAGLALSAGKSAKESVSLADELLILLENEKFTKINV